MMKRLITLMVLAVAWLPLSAQQYTLDIESSTFNWTGYGEGGTFKQEGTIQPTNGTVTLNGDAPTAANLVMNMATISHADKDLKKHLKNEDFFWVKKYPEATLEMQSYSDGVMRANLTIRGITHTIEVPVAFEQRADGGLGLKGNVTIDRTKFEIKYNSTSFFQDLGSYAIKNEFDLGFNLIFR